MPKYSVTFEAETVEELRGAMLGFYLPETISVSAGKPAPEIPHVPEEQKEAEPAGAGEKPKRKRRTKAEIEADKAKAEEKPEEEAPKRRRRSAGPIEEPAKEEETPEGPTVADAVKAASAAAEALGADFVLQVLREDHGVQNVDKLNSEQIVSFIATLASEVEAEEKEKSEGGTD